MQIIPVAIVPTHLDLSRYFGLLCTLKRCNIDEYIEYIKNVVYLWVCLNDLSKIVDSKQRFTYKSGIIKACRQE